MKGWEPALGAPDRPNPPGAAGLDLLDLTVEGFEAHKEATGLVTLAAGAEEEPRDGKASSEAVSTELEPDGWEEPSTLAAALAPELGAGAPPRVGKGSGAPSSPCRYMTSAIASVQRKCGHLLQLGSGKSHVVRYMSED